MKVMGFKTLNGEEVICDLKEIDDDFIHAENCVVLQQMQHPETGKIIQAFGDWPAMALPKQTHLIPITALAAMPFKVHDEVEREYTKNVTGLMLPPATPKILLS